MWIPTQPNTNHNADINEIGQEDANQNIDTDATDPNATLGGIFENA